MLVGCSSEPLPPTPGTTVVWAVIRGDVTRAGAGPIAGVAMDASVTLSLCGVAGVELGIGPLGITNTLGEFSDRAEVLFEPPFTGCVRVRATPPEQTGLAPKEVFGNLQFRRLSEPLDTVEGHVTFDAAGN